MTKPSDYLAVVIAKRDELALPKGQRSEAVIAACDAYLRNNEPPLFRSFAELSIPRGDK